MDLLKILSLVIMAIGFIIVYSAKIIVNKFQLAEKQKCENAYQMTEEEVQEYKMNRALISIKMIGLTISIPGLVLFITNFR